MKCCRTAKKDESEVAHLFLSALKKICYVTPPSGMLCLLQHLNLLLLRFEAPTWKEKCCYYRFHTTLLFLISGHGSVVRQQGSHTSNPHKSTSLPVVSMLAKRRGAADIFKRPYVDRNSPSLHTELKQINLKRIKKKCLNVTSSFRLTIFINAFQVLKITSLCTIRFEMLSKNVQSEQKFRYCIKHS